MAIAQGAVDLARTLRSTAGLRTRQPLATAWLALPDRGLAIDEDLLAAHRRRGQRQAGRRHRRRFGPGRAAGQAAPAEDRQAPRVRDPRGHGRRPGRRGRHSRRTVGHAGRGDAGARRGRDPGHAAAGDGGRRTTTGLVVVLDTELTAGARRRGRRPRARPGHPGPPPRRRPGARRPDRPVGRRRCRRDGRGPPAGRRRGHAGRRSPTATPPADAATARRWSSTAARSTIALRRRPAGRSTG